MSDQNVRPAQTLDVFRMLSAAVSAGNDVSAKAAFVAFGSMGHKADNSAKEFDTTREGLFDPNPVVVPVESVVQPDAYKLRARAAVSGVALSVISEALLLDELMRPMSMATFPAKYTAAGENYGVTLLMHF